MKKSELENALSLFIELSKKIINALPPEKSGINNN